MSRGGGMEWGIRGVAGHVAECGENEFDDLMVKQEVVGHMKNTNLCPPEKLCPLTLPEATFGCGGNTTG